MVIQSKTISALRIRDWTTSRPWVIRMKVKRFMRSDRTPASGMTIRAQTWSRNAKRPSKVAEWVISQTIQPIAIRYIQLVV